MAERPGQSPLPQPPAHASVQPGLSGPAQPPLPEAPRRGQQEGAAQRGGTLPACPTAPRLLGSSALRVQAAAPQRETSRWPTGTPRINIAAPVQVKSAGPACGSGDLGLADGGKPGLEPAPQHPLCRCRRTERPHRMHENWSTPAGRRTPLDRKTKSKAKLQTVLKAL